MRPGAGGRSCRESALCRWGKGWRRCAPAAGGRDTSLLDGLRNPRSAWTEDLFPKVAGRNYVKCQDGVTYYLHGNPLASTQLVMHADDSYASAHLQV